MLILGCQAKPLQQKKQSLETQYEMLQREQLLTAKPSVAKTGVKLQWRKSRQTLDSRLDSRQTLDELWTRDGMLLDRNSKGEIAQSHFKVDFLTAVA